MQRPGGQHRQRDDDTNECAGQERQSKQASDPCPDGATKSPDKRHDQPSGTTPQRHRERLPLGQALHRQAEHPQGDEEGTGDRHPQPRPKADRTWPATTSRTPPPRRSGCALRPRSGRGYSRARPLRRRATAATVSASAKQVITAQAARQPSQARITSSTWAAPMPTISSSTSPATAYSTPRTERNARPKAPVSAASDSATNTTATRTPTISGTLSSDISGPTVTCAASRVSGLPATSACWICQSSTRSTTNSTARAPPAPYSTRVRRWGCGSPWFGNTVGR